MEKWENVGKNTRVETVIKMLDAKTRITIWKSEIEKLFDGYVYQLYDKTDFNNMYITSLRFDSMAGINVIVTEIWQK